MRQGKQVERKQQKGGVALRRAQVGSESESMDEGFGLGELEDSQEEGYDEEEMGSNDEGEFNGELEGNEEEEEDADNEGLDIEYDGVEEEGGSYEFNEDEDGSGKGFSDLEESQGGQGEDGLEDEGPTMEQKEEEYNKAQSVKLVCDLWKGEIDLYVNNFKDLAFTNRLPSQAMLQEFQKSDPKLVQELLKAKLSLLGLINDLQVLSQEVQGGETVPDYFKLFNALSSVKLKSTKRTGKDGSLQTIWLNDQLNSRLVFDSLEQSFKAKQQRWEEVSNSWYTKTNLQTSSNDKVRLCYRRAWQTSSSSCRLPHTATRSRELRIQRNLCPSLRGRAVSIEYWVKS
jgi:hypothetical protein